MSSLILTELRLEQFRKFGETVRLSGLGPGLNLLCAPNEAGKSTLKAALDAVFFTRHRVTGQAADALANAWNDAPPVVQAAFDLNQQHYVITKRFGRRAAAKLVRPDGSIAAGDAAESELQEMLGFDLPSRGAAKPEQLGTWGLLWVSQGDSFQPLEVSQTARTSLEASLAEASVTAVTGGPQGNRVAQAVRTDLARYLTANTRRPTGRYAQVQQEVADAQAALQEARAAKSELTDQLVALELVRRDLTTEERDFDPGAATEEIAGLRQQLGQAEKQAGLVAQAGLELALAQQQAAALGQAKGRRKELRDDEAFACEALQEAERTFAAAQKAAGEASGALAAAEDARQQADKAREQAEQELKAITKASTLQERLAAATQMADRLTRALEAAREATAARQQAGAIAVTAEALKRLRALTGRQQAAAAAKAAAATTLRFTLSKEGSAAITLSGESIAPDAEIALVRPATLDLGATGQVQITPGVQDAADLEQALTEAEAALADALHRCGAETLAEAEALAERRRQFETEAAAADERAELLSPDGEKTVGGLTEALQRAQAQVADTKAELAVLSAEGGGEAPGETQARAVLTRAEAVFEERRQTIARQREADALAQQALQHAAGKLTETRARLEAAVNALNVVRQEQSDEDLAAALSQAVAAVETAKTHQATLQTQAAAVGSPGKISAQIERLETAQSARVKRIAGLRENRASLEAEVRAKSERGPDEAIANAEERLEQGQTELAKIERDVAALQLLDTVLTEAQASLEQRYLAPVTAKLRPYLAELFGDADIAMGGDFSLQTLQRAAQVEDIAQLSAGTQEQLAILSRLAFAEVLAENGHPVVLLLDDALVFADDRRIQDMFLALERAAERLQVIVLSCRQRVFDGLGGQNQRRLTIEPCEPVEV